MFSKRERVIRTQTDFVLSKQLYNVFQSLRVMNQAVHPKLAQVGTGRFGDVESTQVRSDPEAVVDSADRGWKRASTMSKADLEIWKFLEQPSKDYTADGSGGLSRHADEPRQPVLGHGVHSHHVPRMNKHGCVELSSWAVRTMLGKTYLFQTRGGVLDRQDSSR